MAKKSRRKSTFGNTRALPSGRFQARYTGPDGRMHSAPFTFDTRGHAEQWLAVTRTDIVRGEWSPAETHGSKPPPLTFARYSEAWLESRRVKGRPLAQRTKAHYRMLLDRLILPTFGEVPLAAITPDSVDAWYAVTAVGQPTLQSHAYSLLRTILGTATDRNLIAGANPAKVRGGGSTQRVKKVRPATPAELETLIGELPDRFRVMALLGAWCALRFGELAELRRSDIDTQKGVVRVRRGVVRAAGEVIVRTPKSEAGSRDVAIPPHIVPAVKDHLKRHTATARDSLLFPAANGGHLTPSSLYRVFYPAREAAGRPDLRWHDLRHTGATLAAQAGGTLAELMVRLGHSTPGAAMRYQHAAEDRDAQLARRLSELAAEGQS